MTTAHIDKLTPYARNSKRHPPEQIAAIAASIEEFGFVGAIVIRAGEIAKGHGTLEAARSLCAKGKTIHLAPGRKAGGKALKPGHVPIIDASGWSDEQFRAFVIADNKLAEKGTWDTAILADEMAALLESGWEGDAMGFSGNEIDQLLGDFTGDADELPLDNNAAGLPGDPLPADALGGKTAAQAAKEAGAKAPPLLSPIVIQLTPAQMVAWRTFKKSIGQMGNDDAFAALLASAQPTPQPEQTP